MKKNCALLLFILCFLAFRVSAQSNRRISGTVTDTAKNALADVNVVLISDQDTIKTTTDSDGNFSFSKTPAQKFSLKISMVGYREQTGNYTFAGKERHKRLDPIALEPSGQMLQEVVIKGKPNPIRFMQDTVEYNAAAYQVLEGDNVADLMKQFPGMEIDEEYNVKTMGKPLTKLRVNGEDFFTSDVKAFIGKLPAGIVDKIQLIDDFGDEANFTGIKVGEPQKMLNIVTKPGMNRGTFGGASGSTGTNDMIGGGASVNLWNKSKQSSGSLRLNTLNNGAGTSNTLRASLTHRNKIGKYGSGGFNYSFSDNGSAFTREQVVESLYPEGNFVNSSKSQGRNGGNNHNLGGNWHYNNKVIYLETSFNATYNQSDNQNSSFSNQSGFIRQDLINSSVNKNSSPQISGSINLSKKLKNKTNQFSSRLSFALSDKKGDQNINTNTLYYDKTTGELQKDSLLKRDLLSRGNSQSVTLGFNYSLGLKKPKDSLARQSLNLSYSGTAASSMSEVSTFVFDNQSDLTSFVDSLSTSYRSLSLNQTLGLNYNYNSRKMRYNFGLNARPNLLSNNDLRLRQKITNNTFNYAPNLNIGRTLSKGRALSVNYSGSNNNPTVNQLQPIRNSVNLQNIIVGNPDLKPSFNHNVNGSFNYANAKSGLSVQAGLNASTTLREIVEHVSLVPDTLNSLKQITRYENINGNYSLGSSYQINIPIRKNKYSLNYSGSAGVSNRAVIFNNQKAFGKGLNFSQSLGGNMVLKKFNINMRVSYSLTNNSNTGELLRASNYLSSDLGQISPPDYQLAGLGQISAPAFFRNTNFRTELNANLTLKNLKLRATSSYNSSRNDAQDDQRLRDISDLNMNLSGQLTIRKSYNVNFSVAKRLNYGYALANTNPLLLNASVGKSFLKDKSLGLYLNGNDLLGQGNNISRTVSGNSIIDSRGNQQTRVISLSLNYNLSRFGGKSFRVDPD